MALYPKTKKLFLIRYLFDFNLKSQSEITRKFNYFVMYIYTLSFVFDLLKKGGTELPIDIM
jgi:hypothetical protein